MRTALSIDCGTQSLRAILFDPRGRACATAQVAYEPYVSQQPGWAEQDAGVYWRSLVSACRQLKADEPHLFDRLEGVGVTTQRASMVNVDKTGVPLRPAILWMDQRRGDMHLGRNRIINAGLALTGLGKKLKDLQAQGKCNWIRQHQPEIWEKTFKYLQISGWLNFKLTGEFSDSRASQIGHLPFDYKKQTWAGRYHITRLLFPIENDKLPDLVDPGKVLGRVCAAASNDTGLKKGLPVIACGSDKGCETLGAGVVGPGTASLSFGTTATVQVLSDTYVEPIPHMPPYPAPVPGRYNPEIEIFRGFWMITWFKKEFAHKEVAAAGKLGISVEEVLNRCLERTPPGAMGLMVQPYWGPGLDHPDAKGAMIGFGDVHTKDHIYRAVIEGLGFALFEGLEKIERKTGIRVDRAAVSGGASQSDEICRITASIFNRPMIKGQTHETSGLGAAILTARGLGWFPTLKAAVGGMVRAATVFDPDPDHVKIYNDLYRDVYIKMYRALAPLYADIQKITGYPKHD